MKNNTSLVQKNSFDSIFGRYLSKNVRYLPAGDFNRIKNIWDDLCSEESFIGIDDEFYVANVSHERLFPTIRSSIPDLNSILSNAKNKNSTQNAFYSLVGNFLKNAKLSPEEVYYILAIKDARYTLILDMIENPNYPLSMLLDTNLYTRLSFSNEERVIFEDGRKEVIKDLPKPKLVSYIEEQGLDAALKALPASTILAVLGY